MTSPMIMNPAPTTSRARDPTRRKKKLKGKTQPPGQPASPDPAQWKSDAQQQAYSTKLIHALRHVTAPRGTRAVRAAADQTLAAAARGRTRWSRAIMTARLRLKFAKCRRARVPPAPGSVPRARKQRVGILRLKARNLPAVQRKVRVLGRLVPGCRKEGLPVILEEATDYIAALQMQVRAMSALAELLSVGSSTPSQHGSTNGS